MFATILIATNNKSPMTTPKVTEKPHKTRIFAYLRRSTSKEEQKESLIQQEDGIDSIVKKL
ncbi:MAG: hypothetical protein WCJ39_05970 [bacterium]